MYLFILPQNQQWLKSPPCKCLEYTRGVAYWRQDKSGVRFTHECVKRTQIANPEQTQFFLKANPRSEPGVRSGFARVLGCVRSLLYVPQWNSNPRRKDHQIIAPDALTTAPRRRTTHHFCWLRNIRRHNKIILSYYVHKNKAIYQV
jgi:hypothetical protein